jgi:hypothetical protein
VASGNLPIVAADSRSIDCSLRLLYLIRLQLNQGVRQTNDLEEVTIQLSFLRTLGLSVGWIVLVTVIAVWRTARLAQTTDGDTYFIVSSRPYRWLALLPPLLLFLLWFSRRLLSRPA